MIYLEVFLLAILVFLLLDFTRSKVIQFRRLNHKIWEVALNKKDLARKLKNEPAEILLPPNPILVRMWRRCRRRGIKL